MQQNNNSTPPPQATHEEDNRPYNPLMESVNVKSYTRLNVDAPPDSLNAPIPEASFQQNVVNSNEPAYDLVSQEMGQKGSFNTNGGGNYNPMGGAMKNEDAEMGAKQLAKVIIDSYEGLHVLANKGLQFNERKLLNLQKEGLIDLSLQVPMDMSGTTVAAGEFIQELNKNNENTLSVSPQFKKEVTPVLTRVLAKRGAGMTDEQMLIYLFGKDIAVKGVLFFQVKSTMNEYLEQLKEYTEAVKGGTTQPAPSSPAPSAAASEAPVVQMPVTSEEDFNFVQNETFQQTVVQQTVVPQTGKQRAIRQRATNNRLAQAAATAQSSNHVTPQVQQLGQSAYDKIKAAKKTGKRGVRKKIDPKDYIEQVDESQVASLLQLRPSEGENANETEEPI